MNTDARILITTPGGNVGGALAELLRDRADVRLLCRRRQTAERFAGWAGETIVGDATEPLVAKRAMAGVERVYLAHPFAEDQIQAELNLVKAAENAGVKRVVKLGARQFHGSGFRDDAVLRAHCVVEARLQHSDFEAVTVLQPDRFFQNFLASAKTIAAGRLEDASGPGARGYVDARDIAEVALVALEKSTAIDHRIDLSGPVALTAAEIASQLSSTLGRPIEYIPLPLDEWIVAGYKAGWSPYVIEGTADLYRNYEHDKVAGLGDGIQRTLGRPPRGLDDFALEVLAPAISALRRERPVGEDCDGHI